MIVFHKLKYQNFLSAGNNPIIIELDKTKSTLIVGSNGSGKSSMNDALSFALFGKAHRNINKPQLLNSINKKNCEVEVDFSIGSNYYKVVRGLSPNKFEIWKNGELINQNSHNKEYQKILEQNIIKLNHKSFHQIVVLGSSSFIPFMQLPAAHRRQVIEDLLDINIFSKMNLILRNRNSKLKDELKEIDHSLTLLDTNIKLKKKYISDLTSLKETHKKEKTEQINDYLKKIQDLQSENESLLKNITDLDEKETLLANLIDKKQKNNRVKGELNLKVKNIVKEVKFFNQNSICPTCEQKISNEFKDSKIKNAKQQAKHVHSEIRNVETISEHITESIQSVTDVINKIKNIQEKINSNIRSISHFQASISSLEKELQEFITENIDLDKVQTELENLIENKSTLINKKSIHSEQYSYNSVMAEMLKDTGIKTKVIKQYVPVINTLVNQYLQVLDFFVSFDLDENFNETIRSRHRDDFSYDSFSEGEKQRIDLALLFTWRQIARMKNSVATNLLILDETFDSSLDFDGVENLMKILYTVDDDTNVFVISHKGEILDGKFNRKLEFAKCKNFTHILT